MKANQSMTVVVKFNGQDVTLNIGETGLLFKSSHWELVHDMVKAGILEQTERGGRSIIAPDLRLTKGFNAACRGGEPHPVWQVGFGKFVTSDCPVEGGRLVVA